MRGLVESIWLPFIIVLAVIVVAAVIFQSSEKEKTMNDGNETVALDVPITPIDTIAPEVTETATFALG